MENVSALRSSLTGRWLAQQAQHVGFVLNEQVEHAAQAANISFD